MSRRERSAAACPLSLSLQVDAVAAGLLAIGLTRGDRLCSWGPNTYEWVLMQFATAKAGIILVGVLNATPSSRDAGRLQIAAPPPLCWGTCSLAHIPVILTISTCMPSNHQTGVYEFSEPSTGGRVCAEEGEPSLNERPKHTVGCSLPSCSAPPGSVQGCGVSHAL